MAINLHEKYAKQIETYFYTESLIQGRLRKSNEFAGNRTVYVSTPQTVPMVDYNRSATANRYGTPVEMQDVVQEMTMSQDKSFSLTIDKGNQKDQNGMKAAGRMMSLQVRERMVPDFDKYCFEALCRKAGKVISTATAYAKGTILAGIDKGIGWMDDKEVPVEDRTLFVSSDTYMLMKQSGMDLSSDELVNKTFSKGMVGAYSNMPIVKVPASRWPDHVNFMIVYKNAATAPEKLNDTKLHTDPPGLSGNLLEGRHYYDLFVFGAKCDGVYVDVLTSSGKGTVCADPVVAVATGAVSGLTTGASCKWTNDGTDPRYSGTAQVGTSCKGKSGDKIRAYSFKDEDGVYPSGVAEVTLTADVN